MPNRVTIPARRHYLDLVSHGVPESSDCCQTGGPRLIQFQPVEPPPCVNGSIHKAHPFEDLNIVSDPDYGAPYFRLHEAAKQLELAAERLARSDADVDIDRLRTDAERIRTLAEQLER